MEKSTFDWKRFKEEQDNEFKQNANDEEEIKLIIKPEKGLTITKCKAALLMKWGYFPSNEKQINEAFERIEFDDVANSISFICDLINRYGIITDSKRKRTLVDIDMLLYSAAGSKVYQKCTDEYEGCRSERFEVFENSLKNVYLSLKLL